VRVARTLAAGLTGLALLAVTPPAVLAHTSGSHKIPADSLRALAEPIGLKIGVAVNPGGLENARYNEIAATQFSSITPENEMKWETVEPRRGVPNYGPGDRIVRFAERHDQLVRGHTLLWHNQLPAWLTEGVSDGSIGNRELKSILRRHIKQTASHFAGKVWAWDVANEFFTDSNPSQINPDNFWVSRLGRGIIAKAFRWAHKADPHAKLFFNDYGVESINAKSNAYYQFIQQLRAQGVPVHGFAVQAHLSLQYPFPADLEANLQRFDDLRLATAVTELDVRMELGADGVPTEAQLQQQADYYRRALQACLNVDDCRSFTIWGFTDKYSWVPVFFPSQGAATVMWEDFTRKPAYYALRATLAAARRSGTKSAA
jgi:endo-1,4-beta-xylanase